MEIFCAVSSGRLFCKFPRQFLLPLCHLVATLNENCWRFTRKQHLRVDSLRVALLKTVSCAKSLKMLDEYRRD
jgi:hypothetical protein